MEMSVKSDRFVGVVLGTAVGDALGLPAEGLGRERIARLGWSPWRHRLIFGRGLVSDDTDHTFFVAQALIAHPDDAEAFGRCLARKLKWWLAAGPSGVGGATARAIGRLWLGFGPDRSGVFSAGNGPAMRSAMLGAFFADEPERMEAYVRASTQLTHTDPKAFVGAMAAARAAALAVGSGPGERPEAGAFWAGLREIEGADAEWAGCVDAMAAALEQGESVAELAERLGLGRAVSGYIYHTVPVAVYAWLRHWGDFEETVTAALDCGGDTDTVGAIAGALAGATVGERGIRREWIEGIAEWPRTTGTLRRAAERLARVEDRAGAAVKYFWPGVVLRNGAMFVIVLGHVLLRCLPMRVRRRLGL